MRPLFARRRKRYCRRLLLITLSLKFVSSLACRKLAAARPPRARYRAENGLQRHFPRRDGRGSQLEALSARWRALPTPVIGRIGDGRMWLDLRCLEDEVRFLEMMLK